MWRKVVNGVFPSNGFNVSWSPDDDPLYVARAIYNGAFVLGSVRHGQTVASFCYEGEILRLSAFSILCGSGFTWETTNSAIKLSPRNVFIGGVNLDLEPIKVGRTIVNGGTFCGQIDPISKNLLVEAHGVYCSFCSYQVLVTTGTDLIPQLQAEKIVDVELRRDASWLAQRPVVISIHLQK